MTDESLEFRYGFLRQAAEGYDNFSDGAWLAALEVPCECTTKNTAFNWIPTKRFSIS